MAGLINAFARVYTDKFWAALDAADKAVADASWNEMLARTAKTPETFMHCICGAEYTDVGDTIQLDDEDIEHAADALARRTGHRGHDSVVYSNQVRVMVQAINYRREQASFRAAEDWREEHEPCAILDYFPRGEL